jgi:hypothetical protein
MANKGRITISVAFRRVTLQAADPVFGRRAILFQGYIITLISLFALAISTMLRERLCLRVCGQALGARARS